MALRPRSSAGKPPPGRSAPDYGPPEETPAEREEAMRTLHPEVYGAKEREEQAAGERAFAEAAGLVEVTWGEELFKPLDYNGIRLGPFKAATALRPGETVADAVCRLHEELASAARRVFGEKKRVYLSELALLVRDARNTEVP